MWTYIARRLMYAVPILIGVLFLTFLLFFAISSPEDLARAQLQKGANDDTIARWMRDKGYATYTEEGFRKLARAEELEALSKGQSEKGEEARVLEARAAEGRKRIEAASKALPPARVMALREALAAAADFGPGKEAGEKLAALAKDAELTQSTLAPILGPLQAALNGVAGSKEDGTSAPAADDAALLFVRQRLGELKQSLPSPYWKEMEQGFEGLPAVAAAKVAKAHAEEVGKPLAAKKAEEKAEVEAFDAKIKEASGDKEKGIKPDHVAVKRLEIEKQRVITRFQEEKAPLANKATEAELRAQEAELAADKAKLDFLKGASANFTSDDGTLDPAYAAVVAAWEARLSSFEPGVPSVAELDLAKAKAEHEAHLLTEQMQALIVRATDTVRYGLVRMFFSYVTDLFTFNFGENNSKRPVGDVLKQGMWPSLKLMIPAFLLTEFIAVSLALFAALYRGTRIDRGLVIMSVFLMSFSAIAMTMFLQKVLAADWGYFPIAGYTSGIEGYAFLILPMLIYVIISLGTQVRFNRILMLDEIGQDYVRTAKAKGLGQNSILFKHVLRNAMIPLITRWAVVIPNLYLGSLVLESFFGIPGLGGITVQAVANRDVNTIRALVFIGTIVYIFATLLADVLYAAVDPRVKLK